MAILHMTNAVSFLNNDCKLVGPLGEALAQGGKALVHGREALVPSAWTP